MRALIVNCVIGIIGLAATGAMAHADELSLTIEAAVHSALAHNERSLKAPLRIKAAEGQVVRARAGFLPTLGAGATGTVSSNADRSGNIAAGSGSITLSMPLLNLPAIPSLFQARRQLESERWGAVEDRRVLAFETARAFLVVLTTERVLAAATRRYDRAQANQQNAQVRAQAQLASTNDVTRAIIETAAAGREVASAKGGVARARLELGFLMGAPVEGALVAPDRTTHAAETTTAGTEEMIHEAEARRPDVRSAKARTLALRYAAQEPLYRLAPNLTLSGQARAFSGAGPTDPFHEESASLSLSWTLFDAGARYGDRKTRVAQADSQALDERLLRRSIAVDVGTALATLAAARDTYRIAEEAVEAATRNTNETEVLYKQGLARAIELVDANARRFDAEVSRATAKLSMEQAYLELRFALGYEPVDAEGL